jgi:prepilin peptidase dependent protein B
MYVNKGYTLVELLVALAIGVVIMFGVTTTFVGSLKTSTASIHQAQFGQEVRATMNLITRDLKRAGYSATASNDVGFNTFNNDFLRTVTGENIRLWSGVTGTTEIPLSDSTVGTCVTYSYDIDEDGTIDTNERLGFKFNATTNTVQKRTSANANALDCTQGTWVTLTSSDLLVDALSFQWLDFTNLTDVPSSTPTTSPSGCVSAPTSGDNSKIAVRVVRVTFTARSAKDSTLTRTFIDDVKMRNNGYDPCGN